MGLALILLGGVIIFMVSVVHLLPAREKKQVEPAGPAYDYDRDRQETAELSEKINRRFPPRHIFRVSAHASALMGVTEDRDPIPALYENYANSWRLWLWKYPDPPQDDLEREHREEEFWKGFLGTFTKKNTLGQNALLPKHVIVDYFRVYEKWIFREYYAATGIIHETVVKEHVRQVLELAEARSLKTFGSPASLSNTEKRRAIEKATDAKDRFLREVMPAHFEKWGEWFYYNLKESFSKSNGTDDNFGPRSATNSSDETQRHLTYRPNR